MIRRASQISDAVIKDMRAVTLTAAIVGHYCTGDVVTLIVQLPADAPIEIGDAS